LLSVIVKYFTKLPKLKVSSLFLFAGIGFLLLIVIDMIQVFFVIPNMLANLEGMVVDFHPIPDVVVFGINWIVPFMFCLLFLGLSTSAQKLRCTTGVLGISLCTISILLMIYLGIHLFSKHLGPNLCDVVWWF
jgi:hypothetical protein